MGLARTSDRSATTPLAVGWRYFRRHGLVATLGVVVNRYVYRSSRYVVFRSSLAGPPAADHAGEVVFRLATPADVDRLGELARYGRGPAVVDDDDWLFVAAHGHRIVATRLYNRAIPPHGLMSRVVQLGPGQVWMADLFCLPEYRNQGIGRHLALFADRFLASRQYTELFTAVGAGNTPSLRLSLHKGSRPHCYVSYFRLLLHERLVVATEPPGWLRLD